MRFLRRKAESPAGGLPGLAWGHGPLAAGAVTCLNANCGRPLAQEGTVLVCHSCGFRADYLRFFTVPWVNAQAAVCLWFWGDPVQGPKVKVVCVHPAFKEAIARPLLELYAASLINEGVLAETEAPAWVECLLNHPERDYVAEKYWERKLATPSEEAKA